MTRAYFRFLCGAVIVVVIGLAMGVARPALLHAQAQEHQHDPADESARGRDIAPRVDRLAEGHQVAQPVPNDWDTQQRHEEQ